MSYKITEIEINGRPEYGIRFEDEKFQSIMFTYGKVEFGEDEENPTMHFEYDIVEGVVDEKLKPEFEQKIGDLLIHMIEEGLKDRSLVYTGGTDED